MLASLTIAGIVIRAIVNALAREYRLEALMAVPVLLYLVWATARARTDTPIGAIITAFASGYALLLFTEPAALPRAVVMQALVIGVRRAHWSTASRVASPRQSRWRHWCWPFTISAMGLRPSRMG